MSEVKTKNQKLKITLIVILIVLIAALGVFAYMFFGQNGLFAAEPVDLDQLIDSGTYFEGVSIENIDVSGMTHDEAKEAIEAKMDEILGSYRFTYKIDGISKTLTAKEVGLELDAEEVLQEALLYGREGDFTTRNSAIKKAKNEGVNFDLKYHTNLDTIKASLTTQLQDVIVAAQDAEIVFNKISSEEDLTVSYNMQYKDGVQGKGVEIESLAASISNAIEGRLEEEVSVNTVKTDPEVSLDELKQIQLVGEFTTEFKSSSSGRRYNIWKMGSIINGVKVMPGETWSINEEAGQRTAANGWKLAGAISGGEDTEEYGGGICQVSSTLYNAVLRADIEVVERSHHSWPLSYVEKGLDATISWGGPEFIIKNNTEEPIYIAVKCDAEDARSITVQIYRTPMEHGYILDFSSKQVSSWSSDTVKEIDNPSLKPGTRKKISNAKEGREVEVYKHYIDPETNEVVKTEKIYTDKYRAFGAVYEVGPSATPTPSKTPEPSPSKTTEPTPSPTKTPEATPTPTPTPDAPQEPETEE